MGKLIAIAIGALQELAYLSGNARGWLYRERAGIGSRNLFMGLIFRKSLRIPNYILQNDDTSKGAILNAMSNDTERIYLLLKN